MLKKKYFFIFLSLPKSAYLTIIYIEYDSPPNISDIITFGIIISVQIVG